MPTPEQIYSVKKLNLKNDCHTKDNVFILYTDNKDLSLNGFRLDNGNHTINFDDNGNVITQKESRFSHIQNGLSKELGERTGTIQKTYEQRASDRLIENIEAALDQNRVKSALTRREQNVAASALFVLQAQRGLL